MNKEDTGLTFMDAVLVSLLLTLTIYLSTGLFRGSRFTKNSATLSVRLISAVL